MPVTHSGNTTDKTAAVKSKRAVQIDALQREYEGLKRIGHKRAGAVAEELQRLGAGVEDAPAQQKPQRATAKKTVTKRNRK